MLYIEGDIIDTIRKMILSYVFKYPPDYPSASTFVSTTDIFICKNNLLTIYYSNSHANVEEATKTMNMLGIGAKYLHKIIGAI